MQSTYGKMVKTNNFTSIEQRDRRFPKSFDIFVSFTLRDFVAHF